MRFCFTLLPFFILIIGCEPKAKPLNVRVTTVKDSPPMTSQDLFIPGNQAHEDLVAIKVQSSENCRVPKPRRGKGTKVINVNAGEGHKVEKTPLYAVEIYDYGRRNSPRYRRKIKPFQVSRIVITDTTAPVYLVLSSFQATYWEIHTAPGATVDGIYVVSDLPQAVGNAQIDRDRIAFSILDNTKSPCIGHPRLYFNAAEQLAITPANYEYTQDDIKAYKLQEKEYKRWQSTLSKRVGNISVQMSDLYLKLALIGPPPNTPIIGNYTTLDVYASGPEEFQFATGNKSKAEELAETMLEGFPEE